MSWGGVTLRPLGDLITASVMAWPCHGLLVLCSPVVKGGRGVDYVDCKGARAGGTLDKWRLWSDKVKHAAMTCRTALASTLLLCAGPPVTGCSTASSS